MTTFKDVKIGQRFALLAYPEFGVYQRIADRQDLPPTLHGNKLIFLNAVHTSKRTLHSIPDDDKVALSEES